MPFSLVFTCLHSPRASVERTPPFPHLSFLLFLQMVDSSQAAKEKGLLRLEGKDYVVKDGDVMLFRFNV